MSQRQPWSPERRHQATRLLGSYSPKEAACRMGIPLSTLHRAAKRYDLYPDAWDQMVPLAEIAAVSGCTAPPLARFARKHGIVPRKIYGGALALSLKDAERLIELRLPPEQVVSHRPDEYFSQTELADKWGLTLGAVFRRIPHDAPCLYLRQAGRQPIRIYHLADVEPYRPAHGVGRPRDTLTAGELSERLHLSVATLRKYVRQGMPAYRGKGRWFYYRLPDVARWLASQDDPFRRRKGERLLRELGLEEMPCAAD